MHLCGFKTYRGRKIIAGTRFGTIFPEMRNADGVDSAVMLIYLVLAMFNEQGFGEIQHRSLVCPSSLFSACWVAEST